MQLLQTSYGYDIYELSQSESFMRGRNNRQFVAFVSGENFDTTGALEIESESFAEVLSYCEKYRINDTVQSTAVYQKTFAYAQEHEETKEFMASHKLNLNCQSDLSRTAPLYDRSNGSYQSFLNEMSGKYGAERVTYILASNVIQRQNADVNSGWNYHFSQEAMDTSKQFTFPEKRFTDNYFLGNTLGNLESKVLDEMLCDFNKISQQQAKNQSTKLETQNVSNDAKINSYCPAENAGYTIVKHNEFDDIDGTKLGTVLGKNANGGFVTWEYSYFPNSKQFNGLNNGHYFSGSGGEQKAELDYYCRITERMERRNAAFESMQMEQIEESADEGFEIGD